MVSLAECQKLSGKFTGTFLTWAKKTCHESVIYMTPIQKVEIMLFRKTNIHQGVLQPDNLEKKKSNHSKLYK